MNATGPLHVFEGSPVEQNGYMVANDSPGHGVKWMRPWRRSSRSRRVRPTSTTRGVRRGGAMGRSFGRRRGPLELPQNAVALQRT